MNDTQILDWLNANYTTFRDEGSDHQPCVLEYIDPRGWSRQVRGTDLRDCVRGVFAGESTAVGI